MNAKWMLTGTCALALVLSGAAFAQPGPGRGQGPMARADANNDGKISFQEFQAVAPNANKERFERMDTNNDGFLSPEDRAGGPEGRRPGRGMRGPGGPQGAGGLGMRGPRGPQGPGGPGMAAMFKLLQEADVNGDKEVTIDEFKAIGPKVVEHLFRQMDRNNDGAINEGDRPRPGPGGMRPGGPGMGPRNGQGPGQGFGPRAGQGPGRGLRPRDGQGPRSDFGRGQGPGQGFGPRAGQGRGPNPQMLERLKQADANQDGQLTYEEITKMAPQFPKRGFQRLDVNNDGVLSPEDRPQ